MVLTLLAPRRRSAALPPEGRRPHFNQLKIYESKEGSSRRSVIRLLVHKSLNFLCNLVNNWTNQDTHFAHVRIQQMEKITCGNAAKPMGCPTPGEELGLDPPHELWK